MQSHKTMNTVPLKPSHLGGPLSCKMSRILEMVDKVNKTLAKPNHLGGLVKMFKKVNKVPVKPGHLGGLLPCKRSRTLPWRSCKPSLWLSRTLAVRRRRDVLHKIPRTKRYPR